MRFVASVVALIVYVAFTAEAFAEAAWSVDCHDHRCLLAQSAAADDSVWLATVILEPDTEGGALAQVIVPAGVHLASGLFVGTTQRTQNAEWTVCDPRICRAELVLAPEDLTRWKKARSAEIRYRPGLTTPVIGFPLSLMGLTAALRSAEVLR
jgi:invasion protein IalB